jgi:predicted ATPase
MIKQFSVKNYKALESVSIPLTPIHVVIGQNDSGKTSLLEAIHAFCSSTQGPLVDAFPGMWTGRELVHFGADKPVVGLRASVVGNGEVLLKYELGVEFPTLSDHSCKLAYQRIALGDGKMQNLPPVLPYAFTGTALTTTTEDEARITHLHTRNWPCSRVLRRHSGHAFPAILAAFSVVVSYVVSQPR